MKKQLSRLFFLLVCLMALAHVADAQKRTARKRTTAKKSVKGGTKGKVVAPTVDSTVAKPAPVVVAPPDTLPIPKIKPSLRRDEAVVTDAIRDRTPLTYTYLRADDAVYRHRIWREIDAR